MQVFRSIGGPTMIAMALRTPGVDSWYPAFTEACVPMPDLAAWWCIAQAKVFLVGIVHLTR